MEALMMVATYIESLLNDRSAPDGRSKAYIGSHHNHSDLYAVTPE